MDASDYIEHVDRHMPSIFNYVYRHTYIRQVCKYKYIRVRVNTYAYVRLREMK